MAITSFKFKKILIASRNLAKVKDYKKFLKDFSLKVIDLNDLKITKKIKEDGKTFKENAIKKAKFYSQITNLPTIADDSGLEIDYLNGQPGVKSRRWLGYEASDKELINLVLEKLKGVPWKKRKAKLKATIAFALPKSKVFTFEAETKGFILEKPKGKLIAGYPFRSIFYISKFKKPFSLLSPTEEEKISHRKKALRKLMKILKSLSKIKIRKISLNDLKNAKKFQNYINSLIEEEAMILLNKKKSLKEEKEWLKSKLKSIKNKKEVILIAEDKNKIVGISHVKLKKERQNHIGELGISIKKEYRGLGLGEKLMAEVLKLAKKELKPKIIRLSVYPQNKIAQNLYKKFGFKKVAKIPKQIQYKGKLVDEIIMLKEL